MLSDAQRAKLTSACTVNSVLRVCSVKEFLEQIWRSASYPDTKLVLFRGQFQDRPLLPKLFREPNTVVRAQENEGRMLKYLKQTTPHLLPSRPDNDWDWLSLGQHYGMSTRMSDWTANPLVALFFAVESNHIEDALPVVYCYPLKHDIVQVDTKLSPLTIKHTAAVKPVHSHRSEAQAAWHMVHAIHQMNDGSYQFVPLTNMPPHNARITNIEVNAKYVPQICDELADMGMTHSAIYGDFGSVCRSIAPTFGLA